MLSLITLILLPITGFILGLLVTTLWGSGGGGIYVPLLILAFGIQPQIAVATSLVTILVVTAIGTISHRREGNLNLKIGIIFGIGGLLGGLAGAYLSSYIPAAYLQTALGLFLIVLGLLMGFASKGRTSKAEKAAQTPSPKLGKRSYLVGSTFGVLSGLMTGLVGSSGTPPTMAGLYLLGYPAATAVGTSVFVTVFSALAGLAGHVWYGQFDLTITVLLCVGAGIGAFVGPKLLAKGRVFEKAYGPLLAVVMVALGIALLLGG